VVKWRSKTIIGLLAILVLVWTSLGFMILVTRPVDDTVVIYPIFTYAAYQRHGFYNYYCSTIQNSTWCKRNFPEKCQEECLTIPVREKLNESTGTKSDASQGGLEMLRFLGYHNIITDVEVANDPGILAKYHKVIVLHNEYATKREFDAIVNHPDVTYLYANALDVEVSFNATDSTITLIKGHGYKVLTEALGWRYSHDSKAEQDRYCWNWKFESVPNGRILNCYPELPTHYMPNMWYAIKYG